MRWRTRDWSWCAALQRHAPWPRPHGGWWCEGRRNKAGSAPFPAQAMSVQREVQATEYVSVVLVCREAWGISLAKCSIEVISIAAPPRSNFRTTPFYTRAVFTKVVRSASHALHSVVKVILQFLKEQGLHQAFNTLQEEAGVSLNTMENPEACTSPSVRVRSAHSAKSSAIFMLVAGTPSSRRWRFFACRRRSNRISSNTYGASSRRCSLSCSNRLPRLSLNSSKCTRQTWRALCFVAQSPCSCSSTRNQSGTLPALPLAGPTCVDRLPRYLRLEHLLTKSVYEGRDVRSTYSSFSEPCASFASSAQQGS